MKAAGISCRALTEQLAAGLDGAGNENRSESSQGGYLLAHMLLSSKSLQHFYSLRPHLNHDTLSLKFNPWFGALLPPLASIHQPMGELLLSCLVTS